MKAFCPDCSHELPTELPAALCPKCQRKYRIFSGQIKSVDSEKASHYWKYQVVLENEKRHLLRFQSKASLPLIKSSPAVFLFYGPEALGSYCGGVWTPIIPPDKRSSGFRRYLLALAYPVTALAIVQMFRLFDQGTQLIDQSPGQAFFFLILIIALGVLPTVWWIIETLFPEGPPKDKMAIPDLFPDETPTFQEKDPR